MFYALYYGASSGGRFLNGGYYAIDAPNSSYEYGYNEYLTLGEVLDPRHPVMQGVNSFNGGYYSYGASATLMSGSSVVARYANGGPVVVEKVL